MELERKLAQALLTRHPAEAAAVLERRGVEAAVPILEAGSAAAAAGVIRRGAPLFATAALSRLSPARAAEIVAVLPLDVAAGLLRRLDEPERQRVLSGLEVDEAAPLRSLLQYAPGTAGAMMDPRVLALPADLEAGDALRQVRGDAEHALYNLYVVDRNQRLVGVLNLRELMAAEPHTRLEQVMITDIHRLRADLGRADVVAHPGWHDVHSLPVVDEQGVYVGVVRYRTLRRLEDEQRVADALPGSPTAQALGSLFRAGVAGLLETVALGAPARPDAAGGGR